MEDEGNDPIRHATIKGIFKTMAGLVIITGWLNRKDFQSRLEHLGALKTIELVDLEFQRPNINFAQLRNVPDTINLGFNSKIDTPR